MYVPVFGCLCRECETLNISRLNPLLTYTQVLPFGPCAPSRKEPLRAECQTNKPTSDNSSNNHRWLKTSWTDLVYVLYLPSVSLCLSLALCQFVQLLLSLVLSFSVQSMMPCPVTHETISVEFSFKMWSMWSFPVLIVMRSTQNWRNNPHVVRGRVRDNQLR